MLGATLVVLIALLLTPLVIIRLDASGHISSDPADVAHHQVAIVLKYLRDSQATIDLAIRSRAETQVVKTTSVDLGYITSTYGIKR